MDIQKRERGRDLIRLVGEKFALWKEKESKMKYWIFVFIFGNKSFH